MASAIGDQAWLVSISKFGLFAITEFWEIHVPHVFVNPKQLKNKNKLNKAVIRQALLNSPLSLNTGIVYCKISPDVKVRALELLQEGWEIEEVVKVLNVLAKSVGCWSDNLNAHGHV
jgi:hypothetical protein